MVQGQQETLQEYILTTTYEVDNWTGFSNPILGSDLMANIIQQSMNYGVEIVYDFVKSVDFSNNPFNCYLSNGDIYISK